MLSKISVAIATTMLASGIAAAAQFPISVNETGPNQSAAYAAPAAIGATRSEAAMAGSIQRGSALGTALPISVNETGPNQPEAYAASPAIGATRGDAAIVGSVVRGVGQSYAFPISVNETGPNYGGGNAVRVSPSGARAATAR